MKTRATIPGLLGYRLLEFIFEALERWCARRRRQFSYCPHCGRNRYKTSACGK